MFVRFGFLEIALPRLTKNEGSLDSLLLLVVFFSQFAAREREVRTRTLADLVDRPPFFATLAVDVLSVPARLKRVKTPGFDGCTLSRFQV